MKRRKGNDRGFSLVELIVVVAIMAVLMVVLAPAMLRYVEKTRVQKDETAVSEVVRNVTLALGDDQIYTRCGGATIQVKVKDGEDLAVACGAGADAGAADALKKDVQSVVGDGLVFSSAEYRNKTFVINYAYDIGKEAYVVVRNAANPDREWTVE